MMTDNEFQDMSAGFQAAEAAARTVGHVPPQILQTKSQIQESRESAAVQNELLEKYDRLNVRYKHIVEERDELSRQVQDLRRKVDETSACRHDTIEEIKLLGKLLDEEHKIRDEAREIGSLPANYDAFTRHDKFVSAFLSILSRD